MVRNSKEIQDRAHKSAIDQFFSKKAVNSKYFWKKFDNEVEFIRSFVGFLHSHPVGCGQLAENWLLDNAEFIEEQIFEIKETLKDPFLKKLPTVGEQASLRLLELTQDYVDCCEGMFDESQLVQYMQSFQEITALTIGEVRALPILLKVSFILSLAETMKEVRLRKEICIEVDQFISKLNKDHFTAESLNDELNKIGQSQYLSGPWIVHLISHLREYADDSDMVREWLKCRFENKGDINKIVTYEHQVQANYQKITGNIITSLRKIERRPWDGVFKTLNIIDTTFQKEKTGMYASLDDESRNQLLNQVEKIARTLNVPENLVAKEAVSLADKEIEKEMIRAVPYERFSRQSFIAYYLQEFGGKKQLIDSLKQCSHPKTARLSSLFQNYADDYFNNLIGFFMLFVFLFFTWSRGGRSFHSIHWLGLAFTSIVLASEWAVTSLHTCIEWFIKPRPLLRYDFSKGIPADAKTMVTIPVIWSSVEEVKEMVDRLELHYLSCRDQNVLYAILADYTDAKSESTEKDNELLQYAMKKMEALNQKYKREKEPFFYFLQRKRMWNPHEDVFMGWERKRGKLVEFVEMLNGREDTSFLTETFQKSHLQGIRYVLTMDSDTELPIGNCNRMIATMHLPYNRPRLNEEGTQVVEGYGMMQPRVGVRLESSLKSRLTYLWTEAGLDPYAFAAADPYQDAIGHGIFTGKGIFDVQVFHQILTKRIPENQILSHDLLEGSLLRTGFLSDVEVVDDHPNKFSSYQKRLHRWTRGDWQLLSWLLPKNKDRQGRKVKVTLPRICKWQIVDNLRRSLLPFSYYIILLLIFLLYRTAAFIWFGAFFATIFLPVLKYLTCATRGGFKRKGLLSTFSYVFVNFWILPFQSAVLMHAIAISLYRQFISKKNLLEWTSSSHIEQLNHRSTQPTLEGMAGGYALILLFGLMILQFGYAPYLPFGLFIVLLWAIAPFGMRYLDQPLKQEKMTISLENQKALLQLAKDIWGYYEDFANESTHYLPPDNVQIMPYKGAAPRTSPTNIGYLLTAIFVARKLQFLDTKTCLKKLNLTLTTIERLEKWHGHLFNWYDTNNLVPLHPRYVSTVDSGNFVASLMALNQGLEGFLQSDEEKEYHEQTKNLQSRIEVLIQQTDFTQLYDATSKLFVLGYNGAADRQDDILYDLLASEARQTSFVAIALGQIPVSHWFVLGRSTKLQGKYKSLLSWSGTMFEYLMPWQLMKTYPSTIWESTYKGIVLKQIQYAHEHGVPFGISESGYFAYDHQMNYQYHAFGVPATGFKRGNDEDLVLAPYATIMALPFALSEGLHDLNRMAELGARGKYGYYEAIDYTKRRMPEGSDYQIVRSFMAHHQGMSLLTLANLLLPIKMYDYFHRDKRVQSAELLLKERVPNKVSVTHKEVTTDKKQMPHSIAAINHVRRFIPMKSPVEVNIHSNGRLTSVLNSQGGGYIQADGKAVTRWRENDLNDQWGSFLYIRDVQEDSIVSPTFLPCKNKTKKATAQFSLNQSIFIQSTETLQTRLEICVPLEINAELRKLTLTNLSNETKEYEVTSYVELVLAPRGTDEAHPAFSKLFIETESVLHQRCLLARKRPRHQKEETLWAYHTLFSDDFTNGRFEFESDRNAFIKRGNSYRNPAQLRDKLQGATGAVTDPIFSIRNRLVLPPGSSKVVYQLTGIADSKEIALKEVETGAKSTLVENMFKEAWTYGQIELRHFRLKMEDISVFHQLASRIFYSVGFSEERKLAILANQAGVKNLWSLGISGDHPIVLIRISEVLSISFARQCIRCHEYLRKNGIRLSFVFLNESTDNYQQEIQTLLRRVIDQNMEYGLEEAGKIHIVNANHIDEDSKTLLFALSRLILLADGPSLKAQLRLSRMKNIEGPANANSEIDESTIENPPTFNSNDLLFFNGRGGFTKDGSEYKIYLDGQTQLPHPWINVLANPKFGTLTTEKYSGYTWWHNSRECKLTPWSNDPTVDVAGEACYLKDGKTERFLRLGDTSIPTVVTYGRGYSKYTQSFYGFQTEMMITVPLEDTVKLIKCRVKNHHPDSRECTLTYFANWVIGVRSAGNQSMIMTEWDHENDAMITRNHFQDHFQHAHVFLSSSSSDQVSWTGNRREFFGELGNVDHPEGLKKITLSNETGVFQDACGVIQVPIKLEPGEEKEIVFILGCESSYEAAIQLIRKYKLGESFENEFEKSQAFLEQTVSQIQVETPSTELNIMLNSWLMYQTLVCRIWARTAFYQAGGAYGFRDQLQDSLALLHVHPHLTREQILLHASHQYVEGDVQHWWHEDTDVGIRTRFSDDLLWLPYAVLRYIDLTGDKKILEEMRAFLHSEPLEPDNHERYEATVQSSEEGTLYEHCIRAIDRSLLVGEHGLPLMGIGDWNDGMSTIGAEGRGESVWLGWFLGGILEKFAFVCEERGDKERAKKYRSHLQGLKYALNEEAWDGAWYRRAFHDQGVWIGTKENEECQIDSIAQSWSVLSEIGDPDKQLQAMKSFDEKLVDRELGLARVLTPGFNHSDPSPGYIQGYPPGIRENGGQYTHGVVWGILAWSKLGYGDKAFDLFNIMNPIEHTKTIEDIQVYKGEPYVMAADIYTAEAHPGQAGWTWYTGASGWMYQAGIEGILGITKRVNRLYLNPCIPVDWPEFKVRYRYGSTNYLIHVLNQSGNPKGIRRFVLNGKEMPIIDSDSTTSGVNFELEPDKNQVNIQLEI